MKREDSEFQKTCQLWRKEVKGCLKNNDDKRADYLCARIMESLKAWDEQQRIARMRAQMLKALLAVIEIEKGIVKRARKRQGQKDARIQDRQREENKKISEGIRK